MVGWQAGGFVAEGRVNGSLNLSRALGDHEYKQAWLLPEVLSQLSSSGSCLILIPAVREAAEPDASGTQLSAA